MKEVYFKPGWWLEVILRWTVTHKDELLSCILTPFLDAILNCLTTDELAISQ